MPRSIAFRQHGGRQQVITEQSEMVEHGFRTDTWIHVQRKLSASEYNDDMVVQLKDESGDDWIVSKKGLGGAVFGDSLAHVRVEYETDDALLLSHYAAVTQDGYRMSRTMGDLWLPKSQITTFNLYGPDQG